MQNRFKQIRLSCNFSQEEFANKLGLTSRGAIANIESGLKEPNPHFISLVCNTFNVNETWLRTGEGEMFNELSKEDQVTRFVAKILRTPDAAFQRALIVALSELPPEAWEIWADFVLSLGEEYKKQNGQPPDGS